MMETLDPRPTLPEHSEPSGARATHLLADPQARMARAAAKRREVLRFLRDEVWTVTEIVGSLLGVGYPAAHALLKAMQRDSLIVSDAMFVRVGRNARRAVLHGITAQGLAFAWDLDEIPEARAPWEMSKTSPLFVPHQIEVQRARVRAQALGWSAWKPARSLMRLGLPKLPDAEAITPDGESVAVEIEREIKSDKRYEAIIGAYVAEIKHGRWHRVDYVCPDADFAARIARIFGRLRQLRFELPAQETKVADLQQAHLDRFRFFAADHWPGRAYVTPRLGGLGGS